MKYETTQQQFEAIHVALDKLRVGSTTIKIDRKTLVNLLMDHSQMTYRIEKIEEIM